MLTHLPMLEHGNVKQVMIAGGGDMAIAEEALKHRGPSRPASNVEIDPQVVELSRKHFERGKLPAAFADPRLKVQIQDAFVFLADKANKHRFDLIIADRPDPVGPAEVLFGDTFYERVRDAMAPGAFAVFQKRRAVLPAGRTHRHAEADAAHLPLLRRLFSPSSRHTIGGLYGAHLGLERRHPRRPSQVARFWKRRSQRRACAPTTTRPPSIAPLSHCRSGSTAWFTTERLPTGHALAPKKGPSLARPRLRVRVCAALHFDRNSEYLALKQKSGAFEGSVIQSFVYWKRCVMACSA